MGHPCCTSIIVGSQVRPSVRKRQVQEGLLKNATFQYLPPLSPGVVLLQYTHTCVSAYARLTTCVWEGDELLAATDRNKDALKKDCCTASEE